MSIAIPRININGNSRKSLLDELLHATNAVNSAVTALAGCDYSHGRNFQTYRLDEGHEENQPDIAQRARDEHRARIQKLISVRDELFTITTEIVRQ